MFGMYERKDIRAIVPLLLTLAVMGTLFACAQANPLARAETLEQKAYAAYGTFVIYEEQAAKLVTQGVVGDNVARVMIEADEAAKPVADDLLDATLEFGAIKAEFEAGQTSEEKFLIAMSNLNLWVERLQPLVTDLVESVQGASQ